MIVLDKIRLTGRLLNFYFPVWNPIYLLRVRIIQALALWRSILFAFVTNYEIGGCDVLSVGSFVIHASQHNIGCSNPASKSARVQQLFRVIKLQELENQAMKQALDYANSGVMQQMLGVKLSQNQQQSLNELSVKMDDIITNALSWNKLEPDYEKLYAETYTEQQLDDMLTFYSSPTGQVVVEKTPLLLKQGNAIAQQRMGLAIPEIRKLLKDYAAQVAAAAQHSQPKP